MNDQAVLSTADELNWCLLAKNDKARVLLAALAKAMKLGVVGQGYPHPCRVTTCHKIVCEVRPREVRWREFPTTLRGDRVHCPVGPVNGPKRLALQMARVAQIAVLASEGRGGLLVHGALAARNGRGVVLAGPSGAGKSTASRRLPPPWRSLSDDACLIVKAADGAYWAHPWPTWSRFRDGDLSGEWDVLSPVRLDLICMLALTGKTRLTALPKLQAISELVDVAGQAITLVANGLSAAAYRRLNVTRFRNAVAIGRQIPVCRLELSRRGLFWREIEAFLEREPSK